MSKNSAYFANAKTKDKKTDKRIEACKRKLKGMYQKCMFQTVSTSRVKAITATEQTPAGRRAFNRAEQLCQNIEKSRRLDRTWVVVDMDMFFAAVAMRDNPKLRNVPMAVGGMAMISTANYKARE